MSIRIVLIDDHAILRDGLRLRLQGEPNLSVVAEAGSAIEAYTCLANTQPDVVLMDLDLPGEDGLAATAEIHKRWPSIKILILTGRQAPIAIETILLAGAAGFMRKEDASIDLIRAINIVASGKTYLSTDATSSLAATMREKLTGSSSKAAALTDRELSVLKGVTAGLSYKQIAHELGVSVKSVETYRARLVQKLGFSTRAELIRYAIRQGLVEA